MSILPTTAVPVWLFSQNADGTLSPATVGGGGSGTVNSGTAGQIGYYAATGTAISGDANLTDVAGTLTYIGANGIAIGAAGTAGVLSLVGSTSGSATLTAPAIAGTVTNPIIVSNAINLPNGSLAGGPAIGFTGANSTTGLFWDNPNGGLAWSESGIEEWFLGNNRFAFNASMQVGFSNTSSAGGTTDISFSRKSAGILQIGNGGINDSGTIDATLYQAAGTPGVTAGPFAAITNIQTIGGIVTALADVSDARLKDSEVYNDGLSAILGLEPVRYTWNEKGSEITSWPSTRKFVGFIAQNVAEFIPEAVNEDGKNGYLGMDDRPIVAALVNAVKELASRTKLLEERV